MQSPSECHQATKPPVFPITVPQFTRHHFLLWRLMTQAEVCTGLGVTHMESLISAGNTGSPEDL